MTRSSIKTCLSTAKPTAAYVGETFFETDTKNTIIWDGFIWLAFSKSSQFANALSASFDGADDYLQPSSAISFTGAFTLSMWFKQTTDALGILVYGNTAYIEPSGLTGRVLVNGSAYGGHILSATNSYTFGQWSHFMLVKDSSNVVEMWVNGVSAGTGTSSVTATFFFKSFTLV